MEPKSSTLTSLLKRQQSATEPTASGEPEDEKDIAAYRLARPHSREDVMLGVFFKDGSYKALDYSMMHPVDMPHPDTIELTFGRGISPLVLTIKGKLLRELRYHLKCKAVHYIREGTPSEEALKGPNEAHIDSITIKEIKE